MTEQDRLLREFTANRAHLARVAYATLGSLTEAEDCVQEAWLRLQRQADPDTIQNVAAWLTTTVSRIALDTLGSARARRERYVGPWLPEPLVQDIEAADPADRVTLDESVSMALLVVLERLSAAERTAFLLSDIFGMSSDEIGEVVGRSPAAVRQLASRARKHVEDGRPRFPPTTAEQRELVTAFAAACSDGNLESLVTLLDPEVVWRSDGGGKVAIWGRIEHGIAAVLRGAKALTRRPPRAVRMALVNGAPGLVVTDLDGILTVASFTVDAGRIVAIDVIRNPDKLTGIEG